MNSEFSNLHCSNCKNRDSSTFVQDHQHGEMICTKCGGCCQSYQMMKASYSDYSTHNVPGNEIKTQVTSVYSKRSKNTVFKIRSSLSKKIINVTNTISYLLGAFDMEQDMSHYILSYYTRQKHIYETDFVVNYQVWAAACFYIYSREKKTPKNFKEISLLLENVESKKISKAVKIIKKNDVKAGYIEHASISNCIPRYAQYLNMSFKQQRLSEAIIVFIEEREIIQGLNPLSIISTSIFLTLTLTTEDISDGFVKQLLTDIGKVVQIAPNTIRKGIRASKHPVLKMIRHKKSLDNGFVPIVKIQHMNVVDKYTF